MKKSLSLRYERCKGCSRLPVCCTDYVSWGRKVRNGLCNVQDWVIFKCANGTNPCTGMSRVVCEASNNCQCGMNCRRYCMCTLGRGLQIVDRIDRVQEFSPVGTCTRVYCKEGPTVHCEPNSSLPSADPYLPTPTSRDIDQHAGRFMYTCSTDMVPTIMDHLACFRVGFLYLIFRMRCARTRKPSD